MNKWNNKNTKVECINLDKNSRFYSNENQKTINTNINDVKGKLSDIFFDKIDRYYNERKYLLREMQSNAFQSFIFSLKQWVNEWLIKLPMWTWKTRLFCEITKALNLPTIILVPRIGLVSDSYECLVWDWDSHWWVWFSEKQVCKISSEESCSVRSQLENFLEKSWWKIWVSFSNDVSIA